MIVDRDRARKPLIFIFSFLFLLIVFLLWRSSPLIYLFNNAATQLIARKHGLFLNLFLWPAANFSRPLIILLLVLAIAFYMWGSNFKIPALWFLLTMLSVFPLDSLLTTLVYHPFLMDRPITTGKQFPSLPVLTIFLMLQFFFVLLVPEFNKKAKKAKNRMIALAIFWLLLVSFAVVAFHYNSVIEVIAALLAGYAWFLISEEFYYSYARILSRLKTFRGSWI